MYAHVLLTPDIRLDGEGIVCKALWCGPFDGELGPSMGSVGVTCHQPAQPKVGNLHDMILSDQAVPRCKVPERGIVKQREEGTEEEGEIKVGKREIRLL